MTNKEIIKLLSRTSKFMELHGANEFKIKSYNNAIFNLERTHDPLEKLELKEIENINGVGKSIAGKIDQINRTGTLDLLEQYIADTPPGVIDLMNIRGIGIKKLRTLWQKHHIDSKNALHEALEADALVNIKGLGGKTLENIRQALDFAIAAEGKLHYATAESLAAELVEKIKNSLTDVPISFTGKIRRRWGVIDRLELLVGTTDFIGLNKILSQSEKVKFSPKLSGPSTWRGRTTGDYDIEISIYLTSPEQFFNQLIITTGSGSHISFENAGESLKSLCGKSLFNSEEAAYRQLGIAFCEPEIREGNWELPLALENKLPDLLTVEDLQGIIHNHTTYSDGQHTIKEMARGCMELGYAYLGISDHSKAAYYYANGLFEERVAAQQKEIDSINQEIAPFRIFKGIEADILANGDLDYDKTTLESFEFIVASIHSGLNMDKIKATERLITAIANPFTTILGHMTGRLLLLRAGYPVDHEAIIKACAEFKVIIEINAHPHRLDIDWHWVKYALDQGVLLSVNPDAHSIEGYANMRFGVLCGRKGGLTKEQTFNAWPLEKVKKYLSDRKKSIN
jgi:DNA polymerase (family 10)